MIELRDPVPRSILNLSILDRLFLENKWLVKCGVKVRLKVRMMNQPLGQTKVKSRNDESTMGCSIISKIHNTRHQPLTNLK